MGEALAMQFAQVKQAAMAEMERGGGGDLAKRATDAAGQGGTSQGAAVMKQLAELLPDVSHQGLRCVVAGQTLLGLQLCEQSAQHCITTLVEGLKGLGADEPLVLDAAWALNKLTQSCACSRQWVITLGGLAAVKQALLAFPGNTNMVKCCTWMTYNLVGIEGLLEFLTDKDFPNAVVVEVLWGIFELYKGTYTQEMYQHKERLFTSVLDLLRQRGDDYLMLRSCCCTVEVLLQDDDHLMQRLVELGGVELLLTALRRLSQLVTEEGADDLAYVCCSVVASVSHYGSALERRMLLQGTKVSEQLLEIATRGRGNAAEERAMCALGQLQGMQAVAEIMRQHRTMRSVVRGGLDAFAELVEDTEFSEHASLPFAIRVMLELKAEMEQQNPPVMCRTKLVGSLCGAAQALAHHDQGAQVPELLEAVRILMQDVRGEVDAASGIAEIVVEALGRVALAAEAWRKLMKDSGGTDLASWVIRTETGNPKLVKYSFWFAACMEGVPFVVRQMLENKRSHDVVDAAFCSIIDILDDDVEGDWVLAHQRGSVDADLPEILALFCEVVRLHSNAKVLQYRGCHCIGLIGSMVPRAAPQLQTAIIVLCAAVRRWRFSCDVARDACYAFRNLLRFVNGESDPVVMAQLRQDDVEEITTQALDNFAGAGEAEVLEHAAFVLAAVAGIEAVLKVMHNAGPGPVRTCAVKALFEFCQRVQLPAPIAKNTSEAVYAMVPESPDDHMMQQHAELLIGLCVGMIRMQEQQAFGMLPGAAT